jgi:hypothetical protein
MEFTKKLREGVRRGDITCSIRIWQRLQVKVGGQYATGAGPIEIDSIERIELADITPALARESGFASVVDLLKIAKHGAGENVYLIRFHVVGAKPDRTTKRAKKSATKAKASSNGERQRARVARIVGKLTEAKAVPVGPHLRLEVRDKRFGWFMHDHHGDGRTCINCKASADMHDVLKQLGPTMFHIPKYVGHRGWIGLWLDVPKLDWTAVELALTEAYRLAAPKSLLRTLS